jgi:hypothetical protein
MATLLSALVAFLKEHQHCGGLEGAVEGDQVWITCGCSAVMRLAVDEWANEHG